MQKICALFLVFIVFVSQIQSASVKILHKNQIISLINNSHDQESQLIESSMNSFSFSTQQVVDQVLTLLQNLQAAAKKDQQDLRTAWAKQRDSLKALLKQATDSYNNKVQKEGLQKDIKTRKDNIQSNKQKIQTDSVNLKKSIEQKCTSNEIYVNHIINHRDAINLFKILLEAINSYANGKFIQVSMMNNAVSTLNDYINLFAEEHSQRFQQIMSQMKQIAQSSPITDDQKTTKQQTEYLSGNATIIKVNDYSSQDQYKIADRVKVRQNINDQYKDNNKQQIKIGDLDQKTVQDLQAIKSQLRQLLNKLIDNETVSQQKDSKVEADSNEAQATYKQQIQNEQRKLTRDNEKLTTEIQKLDVQLHDKIAELNTCRDEQSQLLVTKNKSQKTLDDARSAFQQRDKSLDGEISLFDQLAKYYQDKVYQVAQSADKQRIQDYANNSNFKNSGSYTANTVSKVNPLKIQS